MACRWSGAATPTRRSRIFTGLLKSHGDSPELNVILGQAHAEQGDFDAAIPLLQRALQAKPDVPDASAALGTIYFKQGKLTEAEAVLRAGLAARPDDMTARQTLAAALEQQGKGDAAVPLLREVLAARPRAANSRYLLGKILLAEGHALEARRAARRGRDARSGGCGHALPARTGLPAARTHGAGRRAARDSTGT